MSRRYGIFLGLMLAFGLHKGYAQEGDLIGFRGGYKALSRLCEQRLDHASRILANGYSRGYFVSVSIAGGTDTVADVSFLTATPPVMAREITWALKGTNGQWIRRPRERKLLIPIFFCQNTPPNDSLFSELLVTNNVGFSVPNFPDQWPEAAEGVWLHPICPLISSGAAGEPAPAQAAVTMQAAAPQAAASVPATGAPAPAAPAPANTAIAPVTSSAVAAAPAAAATAPADAAPAAGSASPQPPPGYVLVKATAPAGPDTLSASGIFKTKQDFDKGTVYFGSPSPMEEKGLLSWFPVEYSAYGTVRVKSAGKDNQEFATGSVFGFRSDNIAYVYLKSLKQYLSVIYGGSPFYIFMDVRKEQGYNGGTNLDGIFMYARSLDGPVREFSRRNIESDFAANPQMVEDMQTLRKGMEKHSVTMGRGDFEACRQLAADALSKYTGTTLPRAK
jgi:hypothetical protein